VRYLGYAEAVIAPWKLKRPSPVPILLLSATILQRNHHFDEALKELKEIIKKYPDHAEALLLQASIYQVKGQYDAAKESCRKLLHLSTLPIGLICSAQLEGLTGNLEYAFRQISQMLNINNQGLTPEIHQWLMRIYIDLAQRLKKENIVENSFKQIMTNNPSSEIKIAYADWLLSKGLFEEVIQLAIRDTKDDGMLLRLIIAEKALIKSDAKTHTTLLSDRFAAAKLRNERTHLREEAKFMLEVLGKSSEALQLATANWAIQKEPADGLLLLDAAIATKSLSDARPVLEWLKKTHIQDPALEQRTKRLANIF
jgi:predicted Zn-dependent protease